MDHLKTVKYEYFPQLYSQQWHTHVKENYLMQVVFKFEPLWCTHFWENGEKRLLDFGPRGRVKYIIWDDVIKCICHFCFFRMYFGPIVGFSRLLLARARVHVYRLSCEIPHLEPLVTLSWSGHTPPASWERVPCYKIRSTNTNVQRQVNRTLTLSYSMMNEGHPLLSAESRRGIALFSCLHFFYLSVSNSSFHWLQQSVLLWEGHNPNGNGWHCDS